MMKPGLDRRLPKLLLYQKVIILFTVLWLGFALVREAFCFIYSPLVQGQGRAILAFSIPLTLVGTAAPLLVAVWLCWNGYRLKHDQASRSLYEAVRIELDGNASIGFGGLLFLGLFFPICVFMEHWGAVSVIPLTTPACGMLAALIGRLVFRRTKTDSRRTLLALLICSILATEYVDWNPRKSLLRDLYRIRIGMTVGEAEEIMKRHNDQSGWPDDLDGGFKDEDSFLGYISGPDGAYNADIGTIEIKDGKVEAVKFSHD